MKILWTVNSIMPDIAEQLGLNSGHAISWIDAMSKRLSAMKDIELSIAIPGNTKYLLEKQIDRITYFVLPKDSDVKDYWGDIIKRFRPDVIHAYGTEGKHNLLLLKNHKDKPILVSLQGILNEYVHHYYAGIDFLTMLRYSTLKDLYSPSCFFKGKQHFSKRAQNERLLLKLANNVEGRSTWDKVSALNINPALNYFYCPRMLRQPFYERKWIYSQCEPHSISVSEAHYPIKGLHFVLEALSKLKEKYPDIKLYVAGNDILHPSRLSRKLFPSGYVKYLKHLIKEYQLENHIVYLGKLTASQMADRLSTINIHVVSSSIENAPNSLAEAMVLGTPTIASFVGGNMDMLENGKEGYLYCYNEPNMLAEYISRIFDSQELAEFFSRNARTTALKRHDPDTLVQTLLNIYSQLI